MNLEKEIENLKTEKEIEDIEHEGTEETSLNLTMEKAMVISEPAHPTVEALILREHRGKLNLKPNYQRHFVWTKKTASNLIESLLLNIPIPSIFVSEDKNGIWEVIDGQQRLRSIFQFIEGKFQETPAQTQNFTLNHLDVLTSLSGKCFKDLDDALQERILSKPLPLIVIKSSTNEDVKFEMFNRLNSNITKLNNQELRNCLYRGTYNDFMKEIAQNATFQKLLNRPNYKKRMLDVELVLMFFSFLDKNYDQYNGGMKQLLNKNMLDNQNKPRSEFKEKEEKFKKSIDLINDMFHKGEAFRIFTSDHEGNCHFTEQFNQGLFLILMYGFTPYEKHQVHGHLEELRERFLSLQVNNEDFRNSLQGSGTNTRTNTIKKFRIWINAIQEILNAPQDNPRCFPRHIKEKLYNENPICKICGHRIFNIEDAEVDHITAYAKGGKTILENAQLAHRHCNRYKSDN